MRTQKRKRVWPGLVEVLSEQITWCQLNHPEHPPMRISVKFGGRWLAVSAEYLDKLRLQGYDTYEVPKECII